MDLFICVYPFVKTHIGTGTKKPPSPQRTGGKPVELFCSGLTKPRTSTSGNWPSIKHLLLLLARLLYPYRDTPNAWRHNSMQPGDVKAFLCHKKVMD